MGRLGVPQFPHKRMSGFLLALDQGTTGSRALIFDRSAKLAGSAYREFRQYYPKPGWVEHDPEEIWDSILDVIHQAAKNARIRLSDLQVIGITNQRETTVLWDRKTGKPVHPAIVWQDRRTAEFCEKLKRAGREKKIREKTGLVLDPYFSATKISWLLEHVPGLRRRAGKGEICFGTIDTWLLWKLTGGKSFITDYTNASRTLIFNIKTRRWDPELLRIFGIPSAMLPEAKDSGADFGTVDPKVFPGRANICAMIGDQQAALYGQSCYRTGQAKNTYGTGCFLLMNLGKKYEKPPFGLLTTLACDEEGRSTYAFEGAVFIGGAVIQWLRDGMKFFKKAAETEKIIRGMKDSGGVVLIPAFAGLGSPYWNPHVRGMISGMTRGTEKKHIVRAALESIAQQSADVLEAMQAGGKHPLKELKVDGGATCNRFLMQFQADLNGIPVLVSDMAESTAWGAAKLAAHRSHFWSVRKEKRKYKVFRPLMPHAQSRELRAFWKKEVSRLLAF